jgi:hypothetical protein
MTSKSPSLGAFNEHGDRQGDCPITAAEEASGDCVTLGMSRSNSLKSGTLTAGGGKEEGAILLLLF